MLMLFVLRWLWLLWYWNKPIKYFRCLQCAYNNLFLLVMLDDQQTILYYFVFLYYYCSLNTIHKNNIFMISLIIVKLQCLQYLRLLLCFPYFNLTIIEISCTAFKHKIKILNFSLRFRVPISLKSINLIFL